MNRHFLYMMRITVVALLALLLAGCGQPSMKRLSFEKFPRTPKDEPIDLYIGRVSEPHQSIAIINSISLSENDTQAKQKQLEDLRKRARRLGADAVHDIRILPREVRGFVVDENVPFRSFKQGRYNLYMLRGTAIKYPDADEQDAVVSEFPMLQLINRIEDENISGNS